MRLVRLGKIRKVTEKRGSGRWRCWGGGSLKVMVISCSRSKDVRVHQFSVLYTWKEQFLEEPPVSPSHLHYNFRTESLGPSSGNICVCVSLTDSIPSSHVSRHLLRRCAQLWLLYVYSCYSEPSAAAMCHMLHIGTFHRFKVFSGLDVFRARCRPISRYNICPCWLNSLISIIEDNLLDCTGSTFLSLTDHLLEMCE